MRYLPHFILLGILLTGIYGYAGFASDLGQMEEAQSLFRDYVVLFTPLVLWRSRALLHSKRPARSNTKDRA